MVICAISSLNDLKGSSRIAIFKYISHNYNSGNNDEKKINIYLKTCLRNSVSNGLLNQVRCKSEAGSFKILVFPKSAKNKIGRSVVTKKLNVNQMKTKDATSVT